MRSTQDISDADTDAGRWLLLLIGRQQLRYSPSARLYKQVYRPMVEKINPSY